MAVTHCGFYATVQLGKNVALFDREHSNKQIVVPGCLPFFRKKISVDDVKLTEHIRTFYGRLVPNKSDHHNSAVIETRTGYIVVLHNVVYQLWLNDPILRVYNNILVNGDTVAYTKTHVLFLHVTTEPGEKGPMMLPLSKLGYIPNEEKVSYTLYEDDSLLKEAEILPYKVLYG